MGILSDMEESAADEPNEPETPDAPPPPEEKPELVTLPKAPSRRTKARDAESALAKQIEELTSKVSGSEKRYAEELSRRDQEIARLRGSYEALSQSRQAAPEPPKADPKALRKEAQTKLDAGDYAGWDERYSEAMLLEAEERVKKLIPRPAAPVQQPDYATQAVIQSFPDVMGHTNERGEPIGWQLAAVEDQRLALLGIPNGPERYKRAFEAVRASLPKAGRNGFSAASRGVLSAVPPGRSAGAPEEGELGVEITPYMREVARKCGMTIEEYAKYYAEGNPKAVRRG